MARGLNYISATICISFVANSQITGQIINTPVFTDNRKYSEDRNTEQIVVKHGVPVGEPGCLDFFPHGQHLQNDIDIGSTSRKIYGTHICRTREAVK